MTWDEMVNTLNKHCDECPTCNACRTIGDTRSCCEVGQNILEEKKRLALEAAYAYALKFK